MSEAIRTEIFASAAVSAAGNTAGFSIPTANNLFVGIDVTADAIGVGFVLYFQASDDGGTTWFDYPLDLTYAPTPAVLANQANLTLGVVGKYSMVLRGVASDRYRIRWTTTSGSKTCSISVVAK